MAAATLIISTSQWSQDVTQLDNLLADHQSGYTPTNVKCKGLFTSGESGNKSDKDQTTSEEKDQRKHDLHQRNFSLPLSSGVS